jgi:ATP-dependent Clp protease ATP-binding subunit ClpA
VLFGQLSAEVILRVVDKELKALQHTLDEKRVTLDVSAEARGWLGEKGYDPAFGARPMGRLVEQKIKKPLAELILFGALKDGGVARVRLVRDDLVVEGAALN